MDAKDIELVQSSFSKVAPIADKAAELFYGRLFEIAPQVRPMFAEDVTEQGKKLMTTLGVVVNGLKNLDAIIPVAQQLAVRHNDYGVTSDHYKPVGEALLWTLSQGLGDEFTPDVEAAWTQAYEILSGVMIEAAESVKAGA